MGFTSFFTNMSVSECSGALCQEAVLRVMEFHGERERERIDSAFGNFYIHLVIEIDTVIFRYDRSCEVKWLIKPWILRFFRVFFFMCVSKSHIRKATFLWNISALYSRGCYLDLYGIKTIMHRENEIFFSINQVFGLFLFFENIVYVSQ